MTVPQSGGRRRLIDQPRRRVSWQTVVGVLLVIAAGYMAGATYLGGVEREARSDCQARVNAQLVDALQQRDGANRVITDAQRDLVERRLSDDETPTGITPRAADEAYLAALDNLERTRAANPLGEVASC